jgi:hypothetical protein
MAKSSKSPSPEFMEKRRKAIVELAKRRRQKGALRAAGVSLERGKLGGRLSFASAPPPPQS